MLTASRKLTLTLTLLVTLVHSSKVLANSTCSRIARVNYQEILVDTSSRKKGEGLRHYLEKDKESVALLEEYQNGTQVSTQSAVLGTAASGLVIAGLLSNNDNSKRQSFIVSGIALFITNFLYSRTIESSNEKYLEKAIEIYNKRNLPRIYFNVENSEGVDTDYKFMLNQGWSF